LPNEKGRVQLQVLIDYLKGKLEKEGDKYIIDKQKLAEGLYIKIDKNFNIKEHLYIKEKKDAAMSELYYFFLERYFYSKIIFDDSHKCIDVKEKKFHSVNPLSLIFKRENCPDNITKLAKPTVTDLKKEGIDVRNLNKDKMFDVSISSHFKGMKEFFDDDIDYAYQKEGFRLLAYEAMNLYKKLETDYDEKFPICIFIDENIGIYKNYSLKYLKEKIFIDNKYNREINEEIFGVNAFSKSTLNGNKPFLKMLSTSFEVPYLVSFEEAVLYYKLSFVINDVIKEFDDLNVSFNLKDKTIENFEHIDDRKKRKNFSDIKALQVKDYRDIDIKPIVTQLSREEIQKKLNYFSKNIFYSFLYDDIKDFSKKASKVYSNNKVLIPLVSNKDAIRGYFNNNYDISIEKPIYKFIAKVIKYDIEKYKSDNGNKNNKYFNFYKLQAKWDLGVSIMSYFSERRVYSDMQNILKEIRTNIANELLKGEGMIEVKDDETYYFLAGQICQYLVSQSKTANRTGNLISPFLKAKNNDKLKKLILETYEKYSYAIPLYSQARINRAIQSILTINPTKDLKDLNMQMFLSAGLIGTNVFYKKLDKNNEKGKVVNE